MKIKQKAAMLMLAFCLGLGAASVAISPVAFAQEPDPPASEAQEEEETCDTSKGPCCGNVQTSIIGGEICDGVGDNTSAENSAIYKLLLELLRILTAGVGIAAVGGIVYGAIIYTSAEDKPEQTKKAIGIITNVVIGIIAYALMYVFLNFLIPGGIFT